MSDGGKWMYEEAILFKNSFLCSNVKRIFLMRDFSHEKNKGRLRNSRKVLDNLIVLGQSLKKGKFDLKDFMREDSFLYFSLLTKILKSNPETYIQDLIRGREVITQLLNNSKYIGEDALNKTANLFLELLFLTNQELDTRKLGRMYPYDYQ
ncbi:MAG: hypothetical protein KKF48_01395 [Nanoarchaeota archaeon]|nr:hypothetical protein [Nanoarchaeota archaeon]MBU1027677.1 hypothetical protein [Nanoarchaeota archaeon]